MPEEQVLGTESRGWIVEHRKSKVDLSSEGTAKKSHRIYDSSYKINAYFEHFINTLASGFLEPTIGLT